MHKYIVDEVQSITPSTLLLNLKKEGGERLFSFQPGQYAAISFYRGHRPTPARCFSIVSSPTDQETLQFSMRAKGHFTKAVAGLKKGDTVKVRGPYGGFVLDLAHDGDIIMLAGGIGITPFMSMAHYANSVKSPNKITLVYSCQTQDDIPFLEELKSLQHQNPKFKVVFVIGAGTVDKLSDQLATSGRISAEVLDKVTTKQYDDKTFYVCGPPPFMNAMLKQLKAKGAAPNRILTEAFAQGAQRQTGKMLSWPNNIYVLSALGIAVGSFVVMVSDLLKTLPPSSIAGSANTVTTSLLTSSRQEDIDELVGRLPDTENTAPESDAVKAAISAANAAAASQGTTTTTTPTTPTPAPAPAPKKCTTTQSGVTTCV